MDIRQADIITFADEDWMWIMGILGIERTEQLVKTLLFVLGIACVLRAGKEHCTLRSIGFNSQFKTRRDYYGEAY